MSKFLILGCHRTGTTLMRLMMDSHPDVVCHDEETAYQLFPEQRETEYLEGYKVPNYTELLLEYEEIAICYHGEPILFMLRDVKDTVCSMVKLKTKRGTFLRDVEVSLADWEHDQKRQRFQELVPELHSAREKPFPLYRQGALFWKYKTAALGELQDRGYPVLPVQYEHLVQQPRKTTETICDFLGIEWHPLMVNPQAATRAETGVGRTKPQPLHSNSIGQWKRMLRPAQVKAIREVALIPAENIDFDEQQTVQLQRCCGKGNSPVTAEQAKAMQERVREAQNGSQNRSDTKVGLNIAGKKSASREPF